MDQWWPLIANSVATQLVYPKGVLQTIAIAHSRIILRQILLDKLATIWRHRYMTHNKGSVHCDDIHRLPLRLARIRY
jgi:hypothetical protein